MLKVNLGTTNCTAEGIWFREWKRVGSDFFFSENKLEQCRKYVRKPTECNVNYWRKILTKPWLVIFNTSPSFLKCSVRQFSYRVHPFKCYQWNIFFLFHELGAYKRDIFLCRDRQIVDTTYLTPFYKGVVQESLPKPRFLKRVRGFVF